MTTFTISPSLNAYLMKMKDRLFEGNIPYMYVDSEGHITVGVGHNLESHKDWLRLKFVVKRFERHKVIGGATGTPISPKARVIGRIATSSEIQNDYDFLNAHRGLGKYAPEQLAKYTTLELLQPDIDALFLTDLQDAIGIARKAFKDFDSFPVSCQAALIDIAYNCGSFSSFHSLVSAIQGTGKYSKMSAAERWKFASAASPRGMVSAARNSAIAQWFAAGANLTAATTTKGSAKGIP